MRIATKLVSSLLALCLAACSGVEIEPDEINTFASANYRYYKWRTAPLPTSSPSSDPVYALDPVLRREVDATLAAKGYTLDAERAQFSVDYLFAPGLRDGVESAQASNISPYPSVTPNRQVDGASVDNAIALGGVKATNNIALQFNDLASNEQVWQVIMTKVVENTNRIDTTRLDSDMKKLVERALRPVPDISQGN